MRNIIGIIVLMWGSMLYGVNGDSSNISLIGGVSFGEARVLAVEDTLLFIGHELNISITDISDKTAPIYKGHYSDIWGQYDDYEYSLINDMIIKDSTHIICGYWEKGIRIVDISSPMQSVMVGSLDISGYKMKIYNDTLWVATNNNKVYSVNVYSVSSPFLLDSFECRYKSRDMDVKDNFIYIADADSGLTIIDMNTHSIISSVYVGSVAKGVSINGNYLYLFTNNDTTGLIVFDISVPYNPVIISDCNVGGGVISEFIENDSLFLINTNDYLKGFDISDPANIREFLSYNCDTILYDIGKVANYVYVAEYDAGVKVIDISDVNAPQEVGEYNVPYSRARNIKVVGNYAYVCGESNDSWGQSTYRSGGFCIVDISDRSKPTVAGYIGLSAVKEEIRGKFAFLASVSYLRICDVSDKTNPQLIYSFSDIFYYDICPDGNYLYVVGYDKDWKGALAIYDISCMDSVSLIKVWDGDSIISFSRPLRVYAERDTVYILDADGNFIILDAGNLDSIKVIGTKTVNYGTDVEMEIMNNRAYLVMDNVIEVLDISDKTNPVQIYSNSFISSIYGLYVDNNDIVYLSVGNEGIKIYDMSDINYVTLIGYFDEFDTSRDVYPIGDRLYSVSEYELNTYDMVSNDTYVYSPNGWEEWIVNNTYLITWKPDGDGTYDYVNIYYSTDKINWTLISYELNDGEYEWTIPADIPEGYIWVKVEKTDTKGLLSDISDYPVQVVSSLYFNNDGYSNRYIKDKDINFLFSNCTDGSVELKFINKTGEFLIYDVYDISGRKILSDIISQKFFTKKLKLERGVYWIIIRNDNRNYRYKLIVF